MNQYRNCKFLFLQNGNRSDRVLVREEQKDEAMAPPVPDSEIPSGDESGACGFVCKAYDLLAISVVMTLAALCLSLLNTDADAQYSLAKNWWPVFGAIIGLSMFNLMMCCGTAMFRNKFILLSLYAAAQLFTRPFCISLVLNIQGLINGEYGKDEYIMAFLCLVQDVVAVTLFITSLCGDYGFGGNSDDDDESGGSGGYSD